MAVNVQYLEKKGLEPYDLFVMELIGQNTSEDMTESLIMYLNDACLKRLMALELLDTVKQKRKSDHDFRRLRLNKKGRGILLDGRKPGYTEEDGALFEHLTKLYEKVEKPLGNPEKVKELLAWFREESGYTRKQIFIAIRYYTRVNEEIEGGRYIPSLENLLWKASNVFATKWKLSDSKLYQFINENKAILNANSSGKKADKQGGTPTK